MTDRRSALSGPVAALSLAACAASTIHVVMILAGAPPEKLTMTTVAPPVGFAVLSISAIAMCALGVIRRTALGLTVILSGAWAAVWMVGTVVGVAFGWQGSKWLLVTAVIAASVNSAAFIVSALHWVRVSRPTRG